MALPAVLYQSGNHAGLPAADSGCVLYTCSDHNKVYRSDGSSWSDWITLASGIADTTFNAKGDILSASADDTPAILSVGANGSVLRAASGQSTGLEWQKNNLAATAAPAVTNDVDEGYTVGSAWFDTTNDEVYFCIDNTDGAAVWKQVGSGGGGGGGLVDFGIYKRSSGDYLLNSTTWAAVDATNLNIAVDASEGDLCEISLVTRWGNEAVNGFLDVVTIVSGSPVHYVSNGDGSAGDFGIAAWLGPASVFNPLGPPVPYVVQSGDVSGGQVTFRVIYRTSSASNKPLKAGTSQDETLWFCVKNLGQV